MAGESHLLVNDSHSDCCCNSSQELCVCGAGVGVAASPMLGKRSATKLHPTTPVVLADGQYSLWDTKGGGVTLGAILEGFLEETFE